MKFDELLDVVYLANAPGVCVDSRLVKNGDIFVAIKGSICDGHNFIPKAVDSGAKYIVCEHPSHHDKVEIISVEDSATAAGLLAQASKRNPSSKLTNLAVTGTNGKTTVAFLVHHIIQNYGEKCGLVGTIHYDSCMGVSDAALTTPDALCIADMQVEMIQAGAKYMIIEASSHALDQNRLAGINFKAAAFTNLSGEHLDYHKDEERYLAAKMRLFEGLSADSTAVLNKQSPHAQKIAKKIKSRVLWYAFDEPADISAQIKSMSIEGTSFDLEYDAQKYEVKSHLFGQYNVSNCLAATGLCVTAGIDMERIAEGLSSFTVVPGRLEKVEWDGDFTVLIDYAHTDDALRNVLSTLRSLCHGKLRVVFGCGGDKDKSKRPRMAKVAEELADFVTVTSDNPRTEHPAAIIGEIVTGFANPTADTIIIEPDRRKAIEQTIKGADKDDIVLIAGKGHETYQIIGEEKIKFSDMEVAQEVLRKSI